MSEIIIENLPDEVEKTTISFEEPDTNEFSEKLPIQEAEIISETRREPVKKVIENESIDEFTIFLSTLPDNSNPSIIITRQPDRNYAGQFRLACESQEYSGTLNWNNYTDASEIYDDIARKYGGGRYSIQVKDGRRFEKNRTWTMTIADPVNLSEKERTLFELKTKSDEQPRNVESSQAFVNPHNEPEKKNFLREAMEQIKDLKEFQELIMPTRPDTNEPRTGSEPQPITKETIKMALIEKALNNPDLVEKAIEAVFDIPPDAVDAPQNTVIEIIKFAASHQSETKAILDIALGSFGNLFANLIPKQPPPIPNIPPGVTQNGLQRFKREPETPTQSPLPETQPEANDAPGTSDAADIPAVEITPFPFIALEG